jgi:RND family efflux transporter MFP subunit
VLRAPFDGVVTRVPDAPGAVVAPGIPVFRIEDLTAFDLRASVSEADVGRVATGQPVEIAGASTRGSVRTIVRSLDPATRRAPVEIAVPNDGALVGHALVRAAIVVGEPAPALRVPASAVRADDTVLVVGASDVIEVRPVVAHIDPDGTAAVTSGLDASSRVVLRPSPRLSPGTSVRIAAEPAAAAAP